jgi:hypothetical protein
MHNRDAGRLHPQAAVTGVAAGELAMGPFMCLIDDKQVPLYRIIWVSNVPHFCGEDDCMCEGQYEVRLEQGESVWGSREDRDRVLAALEAWQRGMEEDWR